MDQEAWLVLVTAATPVIELRGAIPLGLALGLPILEVWLLALIGNIIPVPIILLGMAFIITQLEKIPRIHSWVQQMGEKKSTKLYAKIQRWGWLGLLLFVAIPLPGTGAWTGAMAAAILRLPFWPALVSICGGVAIAGLIVGGLGAGFLSVFAL